MLELQKRMKWLTCYDIDAEYNRHLGKVKMGNDDNSIMPDLIIHKRNEDCANKLIIEIKKTIPQEEHLEKDVKKLSEFTDKNGSYRYEYGMYMNIHRGFADAFIYINGKVKDRYIKIFPCGKYQIFNVEQIMSQVNVYKNLYRYDDIKDNSKERNSL